MSRVNQSSLASEEALDAQRLLSPFRERPIAVEAPEVSEARLRRIVPELESYTQELLVGQRRRRTFTRVGWLLAALSTGVSAGLLYGRFEDGTPNHGVTIAGELVQVGAANERTVLSGNLQVGSLGQVETHALSARISTEEGLALHLGPQTRASLGQLGGNAERQRVQLNSGFISCSVPKLGEQREFSVVTPNARVVVHGTKFSVAFQPENSDAQTCVRVTEGKVSVHSESHAPVFLTAGEQFGCEQPETANDASSDDEVVLDMPKEVADSAVSGQKIVAQKQRTWTAREGTLREETRLLQAAVSAEQQGRIADSRRHLAELLRRFPNSPLNEEARLMQQRLSSE